MALLSFVLAGWLTFAMYTGLAVLIFLTLLLAPIGYLFLLYAGKMQRATAVQHIIWYHGKIWTWLLQCLVPVTVVVRQVPVAGPYIIVANHQSFFDPYCFSFSPVRLVAFVVRGWPFRIPWYGEFMRRAKYLNSEQLTGEELLAEATVLLRQGTSIGVFPEGTRSQSGALQRFHAGAFLLAMQTGIPILPLCINGTGKMLPKNSFFLQPSSITITLLQHVDPKDFLKHGDQAYYFLRQYVRTIMAVELKNI